MQIQYKLMAKLYDLLDIIYFRQNSHNPRQAMLQMIPKDEPIKVIELCTGTATNSILIAQNRPKTSVYGIDRSKEMLEMAFRKIIKLKLFNIQVRRRDATHTGIKAHSVDRVIISLVLHESSPELAADILKEANRLLKENGRLIVIEWEVPKNLFKKILFYPIMKLEPEGFNDFMHNDFEEYFRKDGFQLMRTIHCDYSRVFEAAKRYED